MNQAGGWRLEAGGWIRWADRGCLAIMALGVAAMLQPWWAGGFSTGFWLVLAGTIGQIVTSHLEKA